MRNRTVIVVGATALLWASGQASAAPPTKPAGAPAAAAKTEPDKGCPPSQPIPVPYPVKGRAAPAGGASGCPANTAGKTRPIVGTVKGGGTIKSSNGDEAGVLK